MTQYNWIHIIGITDNEYSQNGFGNQAYFQLLEQAYRNNGIVVPFTYNDPGEGKNFVNGTVGIGPSTFKFYLWEEPRDTWISTGMKSTVSAGCDAHDRSVWIHTHKDLIVHFPRDGVVFRQTGTIIMRVCFLYSSFLNTWFIPFSRYQPQPTILSSGGMLVVLKGWAK